MATDIYCGQRNWCYQRRRTSPIIALKYPLARYNYVGESDLIFENICFCEVSSFNTYSSNHDVMRQCTVEKVMFLTDWASTHDSHGRSHFGDPQTHQQDQILLVAVIRPFLIKCHLCLNGCEFTLVWQLYESIPFSDKTLCVMYLSKILQMMIKSE